MLCHHPNPCVLPYLRDKVRLAASLIDYAKILSQRGDMFFWIAPALPPFLFNLPILYAATLKAHGW